jgi:hypothetical protein
MEVMHQQAHEVANRRVAAPVLAVTAQAGLLPVARAQADLQRW